jgi:hypothetical protein
MRLEMDLGDAAVIAGDQAVEDLGEPRRARRSIRPMMPKSIAAIGRRAATNRLPWCMSAWKKPSMIAWRRKAGPGGGESLRSCPAAIERASRELDAVDPFERHHRPLVRSQSIAGTR